MTNEEKQALINWLEEGVACSYEYGFSGNILKSMKIALAALTAESRWVAHGGSCRPAGLGKDDFIYLKTRGEN